MSQIVTMPQLGETVTEGTILRWLVQVGDEVKEDDPILEISTDKVDTEVPSPFTGQVTSLLVEEGETVEVGASLLELDGDSDSSSVSEEASNEAETVNEPVEEVVEVEEIVEVESSPVAKSTNLKLSPVVRKLASENNVDLEQVTGTGSGGRITRKDIESFITSGSKTVQKPKEVPSQQKEKQAQPANTSSGEISRLRRRIAENMVMSKQTSAHVMTSVEVDYENVEILRSKHKKSFKEENGFSLTYLPFISLATIYALREYPVVNSSFDLDKNIHSFHSNINLGIAVDLKQEGLLVGTLREADSFSLKGLARKISDTSSKLREGSYDLDDVSGSTFTISNNGSFNSFLTSPIINQPNVAILSTESVKKRPVVIEAQDGTDSIAIRHTGMLSLTWDHRAFDGSVALLFLNSIREKLENSDWSQELN
ncbi:MAG: dihydrolipoamide acetyltransferase family protein [Candidatus Actinomarina sp.]